MKTAYRTAAILLCFAMLLSVCIGCGSNNSTVTQSVSSVEAEVPSADTVASASGGDETETVSVPEISSTVEAATEEVPTELPLCAETKTISYWFEMSPMVAGYLETMNDNITYQYLEELTNVHVDFRAVSDKTAENFNLMIASGDWADIMVWGSRYYSGGAIKAVDDGVFMELTNVIADYMPNYNSKIQDKDIYPQILMDDGRIGEIFTIYQGVSDPGVGPIVRKDWLDKLNMDPADIQTYDDYHDMLTAFKSEFGATQALYLGPYGVPTGNYLAAGYGIAAYCDPTSDSGPYYQDDNTVKFGLVQPEFKEYLTMMHQWYDEGLFNSDYINHSDIQIGAGDVTDGSTGLWYHMSQIMSEHVAQSGDPAFDSVAIQDAVMKKGDRNRIGNYSDSRVEHNGGLAISAECSDIEIVAKWVDFAFSDTGSMIYSYGIEGETYTIDESGKPQFTDLIAHNEELGMITACNLYAIQVGVGYLDQDRFLSGYSEAALAAGDAWTRALDMDNLMIIPSAVTLSAEDSEVYATYYSDIATYAAENISRFIIGQRSLDEFDAFVSDIEDLGIDKCVQCWQNALDSYLAK